MKDNAKGILDTLKQAAADKVKKEANDAVDAVLKGLNIKTDDILVKAIRALLVSYAKKIATSYIKSLLLSSAKYVIIALFPPLAPLFAVWTIVQQVINYTKGMGFHVKSLEEDGKPGLYELGYLYKLKLLGESFFVELTVDIVVNVTKLQAFFTKFSGDCAKKVSEYYDKLKQKISSTKAFQTINEVSTEITSVFSAWKEDLGTFAKKAKAWKDDTSERVTLFTEFVSDKVAKITAAQEAVTTTINNVMTEISDWIDVVSDETVESAFRIAEKVFTTTQTWATEIKNKIFKWLKKISRFSRGKITYMQLHKYYSSQRRRY